MAQNRLEDQDQGSKLLPTLLLETLRTPPRGVRG